MVKIQKKTEGERMKGKDSNTRSRVRTALNTGLCSAVHGMSY